MCSINDLFDVYCQLWLIDGFMERKCTCNVIHIHDLTLMKLSMLRGKSGLLIYVLMVIRIKHIANYRSSAIICNKTHYSFN